MKLKATMIESIFNDCFCFCHAKCHPNVPLPPSPHNRIRLQRNVLINVTWNTQLLPPFTHSMINIDNSHMEKVRNSHARILTIFRNRKKTSESSLPCIFWEYSLNIFKTYFFPSLHWINHRRSMRLTEHRNIYLTGKYWNNFDGWHWNYVAPNM